jgi:hypothetical protein
MVNLPWFQTTIEFFEWNNQDTVDFEHPILVVPVDSSNVERARMTFEIEHVLVGGSLLQGFAKLEKYRACVLKEPSTSTTSSKDASQ